MQETYMHHFRELRKRIIFSIICLIISSVFIYMNINTVIDIFSNIFKNTFKNKEEFFYARNLFEGFNTRIKLAITIGAILSIPVFLYNFLRFIFPAVSKKTERIILYSLIAGFVIAVFSAYFSFVYLIPFTVSTLTSSSFIPSRVGLLLDYSATIMMPITLTFWIVIVFEIPLLFLVLMMLNIIKRKFLIKLISPIIILIFIVSAIITPPDIITQIAVALPLTALILLSLLIAKIFNFGKDDV